MAAVATPSLAARDDVGNFFSVARAVPAGEAADCAPSLTSRSETVSRGAGCMSCARPDLWGARGAIPGSTRRPDVTRHGPRWDRRVSSSASPSSRACLRALGARPTPRCSAPVQDPRRAMGVECPRHSPLRSDASLALGQLAVRMSFHGACQRDLMAKDDPTPLFAGSNGREPRRSQTPLFEVPRCRKIRSHHPSIRARARGPVTRCLAKSGSANLTGGVLPREREPRTSTA